MSYQLSYVERNGEKKPHQYFYFNSQQKLGVTEVARMSQERRLNCDPF
jgi:hypothetical protein